MKRPAASRPRFAPPSGPPLPDFFFVRGYAPSGGYCSLKGSVGPSECACGRGPPGHKVRGRRRAARGRLYARLGADAGPVPGHGAALHRPRPRWAVVRPFGSDGGGPSRFI